MKRVERNISANADYQRKVVEVGEGMNNVTNRPITQMVAIRSEESVSRMEEAFAQVQDISNRLLAVSMQE